MMKNTLLAYSNDIKIRKSSTSGGIGSSIIEFLLDQQIINSALSFSFNKRTLQYEPVIIYNSKEYNITGSIYHEIDIISFLKNNIEKIKGSFACFALPCQIKPIKNLLNKNQIESIIIQLSCSSQQTFEATEYLLKRLNLKKDEIELIKYRGDGWPGGINIYLNNGSNIFINNLDSIWTKIFHSKLFCMRRCFKCNPNMKSIADLIIADPWRLISPKNEHIGLTLCMIRNNKMHNLFKTLHKENIISFEECNEEDFFFSQESVINKKTGYIKHKNIIKVITRILSNKTYRFLVIKYSFLFELHCCLYKVFDRIISKKNNA